MEKPLYQSHFIREMREETVVASVEKRNSWFCSRGFSTHKTLPVLNLRT